MKTKIFTPLALLSIFFLIITIPALACPPDDPDCVSNTEATGSVYDQFDQTYGGDDDNGGAYTGEGFINLFARGHNLAEINGQIDSHGTGELGPDNLSAWSKARMGFSGTITHDTPGEGGIEAGGGVCQTSFVGKENGSQSYAGAAQTGIANFEAVKPTDFQAMVASFGDTKIGFVSEPDHEKVMANAKNQSTAMQNGDGATNAYTINRIVGGTQMGPTVAQFTGEAEIGHCATPVWTNGTGIADITKTVVPASYTGSAKVFAREQTGTGQQPE